VLHEGECDVCDGASGQDDRQEGLALWCELWMHPDGEISLTRGHGCTPEDAVDLCRLAAGRDPAVTDRTHDDTVDPDHPSFSWLRWGS